MPPSEDIKRGGSRIVDTPTEQTYSEKFVSPYTGKRVEAPKKEDTLGSSAADIEKWYEKEMAALRSWKPQEFKGERTYVRENGGDSVEAHIERFVYINCMR